MTAMIEHLRNLRFNRQLEVAAIVVLAFFMAKGAEFCLVGALAYAARRARLELGGRIVEMLRRPIFNTVLLTGLMAALMIAQP